MLRRLALPVVALLLLAGGLAFAWWGFEGIALGRVQARVDARLAAERALPVIAEHVLRQAHDPTEAPSDHWTWEEEPAGRSPAPTDSRAALLVGEAAHRARVAGDAEAATRILERVAGDEAAGDWRYVAAVRAAVLRLSRDRKADVDALLDLAAAAPVDLRDPDAASVRLVALYHRAWQNWRRPVPTLQVFLDAADHGRRLTGAAHTGPDDLIVSLHVRTMEAIRGHDGTVRWPDGVHPFDETSVMEQHGRARDRVARGHRLLEHARGDGVFTTDDGAVVRRLGARLEAWPADALRAGLATTGIGDVHVVLATTPRAPRVVAQALPAPLQGLAVRVQPVEPHADHGALVGLIAALLVYALGGTLALVAIHRSQRAASMQADFVAAVSHELKTPIASVRAMAEFLGDGATADPGKVRDYARRIEGEMGRLGATVRNVLDVARIERQGSLPVAPRPDDPAEIVRLTVAAFQPVLEGRGFDVRVRVEEAPGPVPLDRAALQSVLMNLIDNAAKFSGDVKEIDVYARPHREHYRIDVKDRGRGVETGATARLFGRFVRDESVKEDAVPGVGLGLYVVREIVEAHDGTVRASPREGGGSVFTVEIPLVSKREQHA